MLTSLAGDMNDEILCVGELLWDALPAGLFLGGAPLNVAYHLYALGEEVLPVSRVGDDVLGREALRRLEQRGLPTDAVQVDPELQTGFVEVTLGEEGVPDYRIVEPVAWDNIVLNPLLRKRAMHAAALVFGTLAQRAEVSRDTIRTLSKTEALRVYDVNLRPPFDAWEIVRPSLEVADVVKMNEEELEQIVAWAGIDGSLESAPGALAAAFGCEVICITRGGQGALLFDGEQLIEHPGYTVDVVDTVGAGDAFLAALLSGLLAGRAPEATLELANRFGAFVATQLGPTPDYDVAKLETIAELAGGASQQPA